MVVEGIMASEFVPSSVQRILGGWHGRVVVRVHPTLV